MKRRTYPIIGFLFVFAFVFSFSFNQKAKAESGLVDLTYEDYEGVTPKLISYSDYTLFVKIKDQDFQFRFDSSKKGKIFFVSGDSNGTIWINIDSLIYMKVMPELYYISYELEGNEMSLLILIMAICIFLLLHMSERMLLFLLKKNITCQILMNYQNY